MRRARPALAVAVTVAVAGGLAIAGLTAAPASATAATLGQAATPAPDTGPARADRDALLLRIGALTDRLDTAQASVVAAELRQAAADGRLRVARVEVRRRAVAAYVYGKSAAAPQVGAPAVYLAAALRRQRQVLADARHAVSQADDLRASSERARDALRRDQADLDAARQQLDAVVAADDARRAADQLAADAARQHALEAAARSLADRRGHSMVDIPSGPGYDPSPLDPGALLPRHRAATQAQLALMARYPFGPLTGGGVPPDLAATGQVLNGLASWYGPGFNGRPTASGAIYDQEAWTAASRDLPLGTMLIVSQGERRVLLLVNDRGPYVADRILDLSHGVAAYLGVGVTPVTAQVVAPS